LQKIKIYLFVLIFLFSGLSWSEGVKASSIIVNPNKVYTYNQMVSDIQKLKAVYPDLIKVKIIGKSEYGRNIYAISLGKGPANVFINGAHHAREWITTNLNMYMANQYAEAYIQNKKINGYDARSILNSSTIWFVPMVNPDGVTLQQEGLKAFPKSLHSSLLKMNEGSKNFKRWKANAKGIDLNRQYKAGWESIKSPKKPSYKNYKGPAPETAAETKVILKFVKDINPEMAVSYHSSGKILYWNYKQSKSLYTRDLVYAKTIGKMTGYSLVYPKKNAPGGGGFTDWFVSVQKKPAFTPEVAKAVYETNPPLSEFSSTWKENQAVGLFVAKEGENLYYKRLFGSIEAKYKNLQTNSKKLQTYYSSVIKTEANLKIERKFTDIYNSVKKENTNLALQTAKLPSRFRKKLSSYQLGIKQQLFNSENYINGLNAGNNLAAFQKTLTQSFIDGKLNSKSITSHQQLINMTSTTTAMIAKMADSKVRNLAYKKYILPAKITKENTMCEISRYQLTVQMEAQLKFGEKDPIVKELAKLDQLEKSMVDLKQRGNKLHPGKYYLFPKTEQFLSQKKQAIKSQLAAIENS
jgi:g-D-glutamyl-meso-diaminopimelate peptidase